MTVCRALAAAAAIAALNACTDLPDVGRDECGNLVLEPSEDCDGFSRFGEATGCGAPETDNACSYSCDPADELVCPSGWGCGADFRCRRPSGEFEQAPTSPFRFRVENFEFGDVDGDGNQDLIGNDVTQISVRYGSGDGSFSSEESALINVPRGRLGFGDFNGDGLTDVVLPTFKGLSALLGHEERRLDPVLYAPFALDAFFGAKDVARFVPINAIPPPFSPGDELMLMVDAFDPGTEEYLISFMGFTDQGDGVQLPGGHRLTDLAGTIPMADLDADAIGRDEWVLAFTGATSVWVYTSKNGLVEADLDPQLLQQVDLPGGATVVQGCHLADVDGDLDLDLMISITMGANELVAVAYNNGAGTFAAPVVEPVFQRGFGSPFPIATGELGNDARADYVYPEGIYLAARTGGGPGTPDLIFSVEEITVQLWREAVIGDYNGDGRLDVAVSSLELTGVDVFLNSSGFFFNRFHVATDEPPVLLRVGDFDGNILHDIAYIERGIDGDGDQIVVIFGEANGPTEPERMGELDFIEWFAPLSSGDADADGITDLVVGSRTLPDLLGRRIAILQGNSSRRMDSPFQIVSESLETPDVPARALLGAFDADAFTDIAVLGEALFDNEDTGVRQFRIWRLPGDGTAGLDATASTFSNMPATATFRTPCSAWIAGDIDGDGIDELIAVEPISTCVNKPAAESTRILVATAQTGTDAFDTLVREINMDFRGVTRLLLEDLDADGDLDLVVLFSGLPDNDGTGFTGAGLLVAWNESGNISLATIQEVEIAGSPRVFDVAAVRIDDTGTRGLAVLAENGIYTTSYDPDAGSYATAKRLIKQGSRTRIVAGDANNDGLDDVTYLRGNNIHVFLATEAAPLGSAAAAPAGE